MSKICAKCGYQRQPTDDAPDWQCPACGVAYIKVAALQPAPASAPVPSSTRRATKPTVTPTPRPPRPATLSRLTAFLRRHRHATALIIVGVAGLVIGYYGGRAHLRYQLATIFTDAAEQFVKSFSGISADLSSVPETGATPRPTEKPPPPRATPITATLLSKGFRPADPSENEFENQITFSVQFENKTGRDVRAFDGNFVFTDLLDNLLMSVGVAINDPIASGTSTRWNGYLKYNKFIEKHQRLRNADTDNTKLVFVTKKVLYADGQVETYD